MRPTIDPEGSGSREAHASRGKARRPRRFSLRFSVGAAVRLIVRVVLAVVLAPAGHVSGAEPQPGGAPAQRPQPSFALYYGADPPVELLSAYDAAVVEPDSGFDPRAHPLPHTTWFAYTSVGEVLPSRSYYAALPKDWLIGHNEAWASRVVDQSQPGWPAFFMEHVIEPLWDKGYRGFFLDTLDSYQLAAKTDAARAKQEAGLVAVIRAIKARHPDAKLIFNRGFEILPQVHDLAYAVAMESLFRGWDAGGNRYVEVSENDRNWLLDKARTIQQQYGLPVVSIDYCPPADRACARDAAAKIRALGIVPFVTDGGLQTMGIGAIEPQRRRILVLQDPAPRTDLNTSDGLRFVATPLNYLGYTIDFRDVREPLPQGDLNDRYAGIVVWLNDQAPRQSEYRAWLEKQIDSGMHVAIFTSFGTGMDGALAQKLGLQPVAGKPARGQLAVESSDPQMMGFEMAPRPDPYNYTPVRIGPGSRSLLRLHSGNFTIDAAAITPWGGYVMRPFAVFDLSEVQQQRWVVQPIAFLRAALRLPEDVPVPDTTTENGRRLLMTHIDGDGFASQVEYHDPQGPNAQGQPEYAGDTLYRVLRDTGVPTTVSLIEGEVSDEGPYRKFAAHLRALGRKIFELPNVEVATHTFTHPLQWMWVTGLGPPPTDDTVTEGVVANYHGLSIPIPGYTFNIDREIGGSIRYIDTQIAPPGKPVRVVLWSGDCQVPAPVLKAAYAAGMMNLNGGDTLITKSYPSWTAIAPIGAMKGGYFQVFGPNQNEELYTNLWQGPFYGFRRVLETFAMTDRPIRFKPIDVYYHMFSGTKYASVQALEDVLHAVLTESVTPVFVSEYSHIVLDWLDTSVTRDGNFWVIRNAGHLRTVRLPPGKAPDMATASGVAGWLPGPGGTYVHLAGSAARFAVIDEKDAPHVPYLADANGRIENFTRTGNSFSFDLRARVAPQYRLANAGACRVARRPLSGAYSLHVDVACGS